ASMCLRRLSDWVNSHIRFHAESRFTMVFALFLLLFSCFNPYCAGFPGIFRLTAIDSCLTLAQVAGSRCRFLEHSRLWHSEKFFMATPLARVDSREVVRFDHSHLVQSRTPNNLCKKCPPPLDEDDPDPILMEPAPVGAPANGS